VGLRVIHVGGTNGKGSVCAFIANILQAASYKVGMYTSPHLVKLNERYRINSKPISDAELHRLIQEVRGEVEAMGRYSVADQPTFFETATAIAFLYFASQNVDWAVIEVGMGGRLDATNVVQPAVTVITNVDLEHTDRLGVTVRDIAYEKAGIIKRHVPVVTAATHPDAYEVISTIAHQKDCKLVTIGKDIKYRKIRSTNLGQQVTVETHTRNYSNLELQLLGDHQIVNAATAIGAVECLHDPRIDISYDTIYTGLKSTRWDGRLELIRHDGSPIILLDAAHNPAAARTLRAALLNKDIFNFEELTFVLGIMQDKDIEGILQALVPLATHQVIVTRPNLERAADCDMLAEETRKYIRTPVKIIEQPSVHQALNYAITTAKPQELVCVTGSIFTVGEVKAQLEQ
jgi:dihydrofolate synthase/folylpolyglutamate synthase